MAVDQCKILDARAKTIWTWESILHSLTNFSPKENRLFPNLKNGKDSDFFQLENKAIFETEEPVQAQTYKHNLSVFHRYKWMWIYSVLAIRNNCMTIFMNAEHACSYVTLGRRRRLGGNSEVKVGTEEQCFQSWLTILGAYIMGPFSQIIICNCYQEGNHFLKCIST